MTGPSTRRYRVVGTKHTWGNGRNIGFISRDDHSFAFSDGLGGYISRGNSFFLCAPAVSSNRGSSYPGGSSYCFPSLLKLGVIPIYSGKHIGG